MKDRLLFEQRKNSIRDMIYDPNYIPLKLKEMAYLMDGESERDGSVYCECPWFWFCDG